MFWKQPIIGRRVFFRHLASAVSGYYLMPTRPMERIARAAATPKNVAKYCIFIFMDGGPSHIDTFDLKEGAWTPASLAPTSYGGIRFPQGLMPKLAEQMDSLTFLRSVRAPVAVHSLAQTWLKIGRNPAAGSSKIAPHIGSVISLELASPSASLPAFIALNSPYAVGPGYLPPGTGPFYVSPSGSGLANTTHLDGPDRFEKRYGLTLKMDAELRESGALGAAPAEMFAFNQSARKLVYNGDIDKIFTFPTSERQRYGNSSLASACISARNLLRANAGARFIQITHGTWDHHENMYGNGQSHLAVAKQFDSAVGTLIGDLRDDGLLDETLILAMGEFGRTPGPLNQGGGRDHYQQQAVMMAGAQIRGRRAIGSTDKTGGATADPGWSRKRDIRFEDLEATIYSAMGIDWTTVRHDDPLGRGFEYVPSSDQDLYGPVNELWG